LYIHIPWCVRKCPYCDFNSHQAKTGIDEAHYLNCLVNDFITEWEQSGKQTLTSIFIGGGTPSYLSASFYEKLLEQLDKRVSLDGIEITLEANPGTLDADNFAGYRNAGINRLSIGVQSFDNTFLKSLGRIHDSQQAVKAYQVARQSGFTNINLDLMFALPDQSVKMAMNDLEQAISLEPDHLSWYQLTLEPNTPFNANPPDKIPDDDSTWEIQQTGQSLLKANGFHQYEISAYARDNRQCEHNLNYWRFGDYIGIGAGAHGKLTRSNGGIIRRSKKRSPVDYMNGNFLSQQQVIDKSGLLFEYLMNRLRLKEAFRLQDIIDLTGLDDEQVKTKLQQAIEQQFLQQKNGNYSVSERGHQYLNELLMMFL